MKKRVIFLLTGLFIWTSVLLAQNVPEGVIGAFKEGNSQELNKYPVVFSDAPPVKISTSPDIIMLFASDVQMR